MTNALGRIRPISAREVWPHEALDFTPWLLSNVDVLSDLLGMDLVLQHADYPVGSFSLDLIETDESTGQTVIVENQLEMSDHTHLGQILNVRSRYKSDNDRLAGDRFPTRTPCRHRLA